MSTDGVARVGILRGILTVVTRCLNDRSSAETLRLLHRYREAILLVLRTPVRVHDHFVQPATAVEEDVAFF